MPYRNLPARTLNTQGNRRSPRTAMTVGTRVVLGHDHPPGCVPSPGSTAMRSRKNSSLVSWWLCLATASRTSSSLPAMVSAQPISLGTLLQSIIFRARPPGRPSGWPSAGRLTAPSTRWCQLTERCAAAPWVVPRAAPNLDSCGPSCALARRSRRRRARGGRTPRIPGSCRHKGSDVLVGPAGSGGGYDNALAGLPDVAAIAPIVGLQALPVGPAENWLMPRSLRRWTAGSATRSRSRRCSPGVSHCRTTLAR
jgi:hypothetical protein